MTDRQRIATLVHDARAWDDLAIELGDMTTEECAVLLSAKHPVVILPVGSTEPHGPHLPLATDTILARASAIRAVTKLRAHGIAAVVAPALPYGVTHYAEGFAGAISLPPVLVTTLVRETCAEYRRAGFAIVCVTNHHLEPEHIDAVSAGVNDACGAANGGVLFANQLTKRWGRTLSDEFKRGDCHAGSYETSLVMAATPELVREERRRELPAVPISLSDAIKAGQRTFREIGLDHAYTGAPADATRDEGESLYARLGEMIATEVLEALGR